VSRAGVVDALASNTGGGLQVSRWHATTAPNESRPRPRCLCAEASGRLLDEIKRVGQLQLPPGRRVPSPAHTESWRRQHDPKVPIWTAPKPAVAAARVSLQRWPRRLASFSAAPRHYRLGRWSPAAVRFFARLRSDTPSHVGVGTPRAWASKHEGRGVADVSHGSGRRRHAAGRRENNSSLGATRRLDAGNSPRSRSALRA